MDETREKIRGNWGFESEEFSNLLFLMNTQKTQAARKAAGMDDDECASQEKVHSSQWGYEISGVSSTAAVTNCLQPR